MLERFRGVARRSLPGLGSRIEQNILLIVGGNRKMDESSSKSIRLFPDRREGEREKRVSFVFCRGIGSTSRDGAVVRPAEIRHRKQTIVNELLREWSDSRDVARIAHELRA